MNQLLVVVLVACAVTTHAATPRTEHTFSLSEGEERPAATLDDARWLVGSWTGTAFGQTFDAHWSAPSAGSMVGTFKLYNGDAIQFYEILVLTIEDGTLGMKVKHFSQEFTAWEEKAEFTHFRLVAFDENALHFGGFSLYRVSENRLNGYIVMRDGDTLREQHLAYERAPPGSD